MASKTYDFALGAAVGATQNLPVLGSRVRVIAADYDVTVKTNRGDSYTLKSGQGFTLSDQQIARGELFTEVILANTVAIANTGRVFIGDASFDDSRITGDVNVIDNSGAKTAAAGQFLGSAGAAASAGQGSLAGVRAVSRTVNVRTLYMSSTVAGAVQLAMCSGDPTLNASITAGFGVNKLANGAASTSKAIRGNSAGTFPTTGELPGVVAVIGFTLSANVPFVMTLPTPIQLPAGYGLVLVGNALNRDVVFAADMEEV